MTREEAIATLNTDFSRLPSADLEALEHVLGLASGQLAARRYTLPGDTQIVREEVRTECLSQAAWHRSYLDPAASFPPEAIGLTDAECEDAVLYWEHLAQQIVH